MSVEPSSTLQKNENVAFRRLAAGDGGVLLHLESGEYHGINEVGCLIWEHLDGERTVDAVAVAIRDGIEDPPSDLVDEVISFLESLHERDLVQ
jgi:Coenzyme PQQ synthesis protein D (PqqD)